MRTQKGITLIALILTVVVMLVLLRLSIKVVIDTGLAPTTGEAVQKTNQAAEYEQQIASGMAEKADGTMVDMVDFLTQSKVESKGKWVHNYIARTVSNGKMTLNIGDYVSYEEPSSLGYSGNWRVLGVNDRGNLLLVSGSNVATQTIHGVDGYNNGIKILDGICDDYADGVVATSGRSINVEDVNKITGFNPNNVNADDPAQTGIGDKYVETEEGGIGYLDNVTYWLTSSGVKYSINGGNTILDSTRDEFYPFGDSTGLTKDDDNSYCTVQRTHYYYNISSSTSSVRAFRRDHPAFDMLFTTDTDETKHYWLASQGVRPAIGRCNWGLFYVYEYKINIHGLWGSWVDEGYGSTIGVRAVVTLSSEADLKLTSTDSTTGLSTYSVEV